MRTISFVHPLARSTITPVRPIPRWFPTDVSKQTFSSTSPAQADEPEDDATLNKNSRSKFDPQTVIDWYQGEGLPYRDPLPGKTNWLGGNIPFPDNPTFRPPPPLSDVVKTAIYDRYLGVPPNSVPNTQERHTQALRVVSEQFGISIGRAEAIVKLKQYEQQYVKVNHYPSLLCAGSKLQHAFQRGMESYLGIRQDQDRARVSDDKFTPSDINAARQSTVQVDLDASQSGEREEKPGAARRVWWELVEDKPDAEPVLPGLISEKLKEHQERLAENQRAHAGSEVRVDGRPSAPNKPKVVYTFIDTGRKGSGMAKKRNV